MMRRHFLTALLLAALPAGPARAGVDFAVTQKGNRPVFGGRDELRIDQSDRLLLFTNNVIHSYESSLLDCSNEVRKGWAEGAELGEIVNISPGVYGVYDRMVGRIVLQLLWLDHGRDWEEDDRQIPKDLSVLPLIASLPPSGGSGSGSGSGKTSFPGPGSETQEVPEPGAGMLLAATALATLAAQRRRRNK